MYVMYNNFQIFLGTDPLKEFATPHYVNPDKLRYELHRVWVVEANLKEGKRHCYHKRVFYIDEDSWWVLRTDKYDNRGNLWRTTDGAMVNWYWIPTSYSHPWINYDFTEESYSINACAVGNGYEYGYGQYGIEDLISPDIFTVEHVRRMGRR